MMERPRQTGVTADAFIAWALEQPEGRFELDNGTVVAMPPERVSHSRAKSRVWLALRTAIAARGLACEALPDGATVRVNDRTVYGPDALVRCGPPLSGDAVEIPDPVVVVEVVSPSSRGIDRGVKLAGYFSLPELRHYLIVDTDKRVVIHHRRDEEGQIRVGIVHDGPLALDPPGLVIDSRDILAGL
jgi:Uma2 family endonuclease